MTMIPMQGTKGTMCTLLRLRWPRFTPGARPGFGVHRWALLNSNWQHGAILWSQTPARQKVEVGVGGSVVDGLDPYTGNWKDDPRQRNLWTIWCLLLYIFSILDESCHVTQISGFISISCEGSMSENVPLEFLKKHRLRQTGWGVKHAAIWCDHMRTLQRQDFFFFPEDVCKIDRLHHRGQVKHELNLGSLRSLCTMHSQTCYPLHKLHKQ